MTSPANPTDRDRRSGPHVTPAAHAHASQAQGNSVTPTERNPATPAEHAHGTPTEHAHVTPAQRARATPPRSTGAATPTPRPVQTSAPAPSVRPIAASVTVASIALLIAGVAWPQAADALLRVLLVTLAVGFVAALVYRAIRPVVTTRDVHSPFGRYVAMRTPAVAPQALRKLTSQLGAAADARSAERTAIPLSTRLTVREEASHRLTERHGLSLGDPTDHPHIRALVSQPTWLLIRPHDLQAPPRTRQTTRSQSVPLSQLGRILDDLEAL